MALRGRFAVPLWATWPALSLRMGDVPAFEGLTLAFLFAWLTLLPFGRLPSTTSTSATRRTDWVTALAFALAGCGSAGPFMFA